MGEELRHNKRVAAPDDSDDPTQSGAHSRASREPEAEQPSDVSQQRPLQSEVSAITELRPELQTGWQLRPSSPRASRPSIRPSAFGIPRASSQPGAPQRDARDASVGSRVEARTSSAPPPKRESVPPRSQARPCSQSIPPRLSQTVRKRAPGRAPPVVVKTDIEELLPISHGVKSLPRPPRLPTFETPQLPLASAKRFPWASLGVFVVMLGGSFVPLSHYRGERRIAAARAAEEREQIAAEAAAELGASGVDPRQDAAGVLHAYAPVGATLAHPGAPHDATQPRRLSAVDQIERAFWGEPAKVREALLQEAERALGSEDERLAESLFGRALEFDGDFDGDDARAEYGLARVRLLQRDLDGAEGWALSAIRKRPRSAEYRALHAEILQRNGRGPEAQMERAVARALAHFSRGTRSR